VDKNFVTLEQHLCQVCARKFDTNNLLINTRMKAVFDKYTLTGYGLCQECQKHYDNGFVAIVGVDPNKSGTRNDTLKLEDAYRTGRIAHVRRTAARQVFDVIIPDDMVMMFADDAVIDVLKSMVEGADTQQVEGQSE
jgi:hypothetical protein